MIRTRPARPHAAWLAAFGLLSAAGISTAPEAFAKAEPKASRHHHAAKPAAAPSSASFADFVESVWPAAKARGVSRATFDAAFQGMTPDPKIVALTKKQSEFVTPIWTYLANAASPQRLSKGEQVANRWSSVLDKVERSYGVPRSVVVGVWGMETNFGANTGGIPVIRALATLAYVKYRGTFFRDELVNALTILQAGHVAREDMKGSWAGAMGQTQFMPSSYLEYAVDGDGDGHPNIWTSVPDALASTANYLAQKGWQPGLPWGFEVVLPPGFDYRRHKMELGDWAAAGVKRVDGAALPRSGEATLLLPAGAKGPAFLVTANYDVIKTYNSSDAYALGVAHLGDRIYGGPSLRGTWPKGPILTHHEREEVQARLAAMGLYRGKRDGKLGSQAREAVRGFQLRRNLLPDGYADAALLKELRAAR